MDFTAITEQIAKQAGNVEPIGATIKFLLDDQVIYIDGTGDTNQVSNEDKEAACTIKTTVQALLDMKSGALNPMMAVMSGKVSIQGDMGLAMKLQSLI
jgi:putative sterol carrier protein